MVQDGAPGQRSDGVDDAPLPSESPARLTVP